MTRRTLTLSRETLTELATTDLSAVVAGAGLGQAVSNGAGLAQCAVSIALTGCGTSVNPKCPGAGR